MQALLYEELVKRTNGLEKKVGEMDIMVNTMKTQVARLEDLTRTLRAEVDALGKSPAVNPANPAQPNSEAAKAKLEDILSRSRPSSRSSAAASSSPTTRP
jgi:peptidoglycan hydrolase CwlO-like protein